MVKLYQQLEQVFKLRINSNNEIISYIKKLSEMGKFDEPKKVAAIAILLDRLGKLEDEINSEKSLKEIVDPIQEEIDQANQVKEETILKETENPLNGVATQLPDEAFIMPTEFIAQVPVEDKTVSKFTSDAIVDKLELNPPDSS